MKPMTEKLEGGLTVECIQTSPAFVLVWRGEQIMGPATYEDVKTEARRIQEARILEPIGPEDLL